MARAINVAALSSRARGMPDVSPAEAMPPPIRLLQCEPDMREPGTMLFNVRLGGAEASSRSVTGWLLALDRTGRLTCIHTSKHGLRGARQLANGNLLVSMADGLLVEMTATGEIKRQWYATGRYRDTAPPPGAIRIEAENIHHGVSQTADGNMLLLSMEVRVFDNWHGSTRDQLAPRERASLVGDVIMEVRPDGKVVREHRMFDILDPYRISYSSRATYWWRRGYPGTCDWCHANGTFHDARDDSILVTLRTQDCIIKIDRRTGELKWILGPHEGWKGPWADKLLTPVGDVMWSYHPHDPAVTPAGTITCFDNGNHRAVPFSMALPHDRNYSRAVEYEVDEVARTVRQVWSHGDAPGQRIFAGFQGGVMRMPRTGNTFITYGGICSIGGMPFDEPDGADARARLIEVTRDGQVVFDMEIGEAQGELPHVSVFRATHVEQELALDWGA